MAAITSQKSLAASKSNAFNKSDGTGFWSLFFRTHSRSWTEPRYWSGDHRSFRTTCPNELGWTSAAEWVARFTNGFTPKLGLEQPCDVDLDRLGLKGSDSGGKLREALRAFATCAPITAIT